MALWLGALIVFLVATAAGVTYAVWRALQLWRVARRAMRVVGAGGDRIGDGLARLSASSEQLAATASGRLTDAVADLQRSVAAARVVADAAAEARVLADVATRLRRS